MDLWTSASAFDDKIRDGGLCAQAPVFPGWKAPCTAATSGEHVHVQDFNEVDADQETTVLNNPLDERRQSPCQEPPRGRHLDEDVLGRVGLVRP